MRNLTLAIVFCLVVSVASISSAVTTAVDAVQPTVANTPAGHVVNDILIDFDEQLFGQQMVLQLTAGTIYQDLAGGESAPSDLFVGLVPTLASDTFVTLGAPTSDASSDILIVGGSTEIPGLNGPKLFDTADINIAWAPGPGVVIGSGTDFMTARITLSDDAEGAVFYFSNSGGSNPVTLEGLVSGGAISFTVPEPTTALLAGLGLVGFAARRRV